MKAYRKLISLPMPAEEAYRLSEEVFHRLGIPVENQNDNLHRIVAECGENRFERYILQTVCAPIDDHVSLLIFACAWAKNSNQCQLDMDATDEFDRMFGDFLTALTNVRNEENSKDDAQLAVIDVLRTLSVQTMQKAPCTVLLTPTYAVFTDPATGRIFNVPKDRAREEIKFLSDTLFGSATIESSVAQVSGVTFNFAGSKSALVDWLPPLPRKEMRDSMIKWGIGMIITGGLSFVFSNFLDARWGIVLIVLGLLNFVIVHRFIFLLNGIVLIACGALNIVGTVSSVVSGGKTTSFWWMLGVFQIGWGIEEITKFIKYRNVEKTP